MKRIICLALVLLMCFTTSAFADDFSSRSVEELYTIIDQAKAELLTRELVEAGKVVIAQADGITVTLTGDIQLDKSYDGSMKLTISVIVANTSDTAVAISADDIYINGWEESTLFGCSLEAGKKAKETLVFYSVDEDADLTSLDELETIEFHFHTYDPSSYRTITRDIVTTVQY